MADSLIKPVKPLKSKNKPKTRLYHWAWWLVFAVLTFLILALGFIPEQLSYKEGDIADKDVYYYGSSTTYVSEIRTAEAKKAAAAAIGQVYSRNDGVVGDINKAIDDIFAKIDRVKNDEELPTLTAKTEALQKVLPETITNEAIIYALKANENMILKLTETLKELVSAVYAADVDENRQVNLSVELIENLKKENFTYQAENFMRGVLKALPYSANRVYDQVATLEAVEKEMATVQAVQVTVKPGGLLIAKGDTVSATNIETLQALGMQHDGSKVMPYWGLALLVALCYWLIMNYINKYSKKLNAKETNIILLGLLININLFIGKIFTLISFSSNWQTDAMMGLLIPIAAFSMLVSALINRNVAVFTTAIMAVFIGILCNGQLFYVLTAMVGGFVGISQVSGMDERGRYAIASAKISLAYVAVVLAWGLMWNYELSLIVIGIIFGVLNGIISMIMAIGSMPFLESVFKITTVVRLLELSNSNNPLLKKMMIEAPGTYHHSILVANLAEAAAEEVGADSLLVRVASYFHDVGKIKRPYFFIENQKGGENPHDKLQPSLSTLILTSHPKEGAEMAREYKIPEVIRDIIEQHHGTGLVSFFYHKALENNTGNDVIRESDFRYPGPKPQSKEAAIVLLADSVQAAVQAMKSPTSGQVEGKIREVIKGKFDDNQLTNCALTFKDLDVIASAFTKVLAGLNHQRITYPDQLEKELQKRGKEIKGALKNEVTNNQSAKQDGADKQTGEAPKNGSKGSPANGKEPPPSA
jgi:hypothetical protein